MDKVSHLSNFSQYWEQFKKYLFFPGTINRDDSCTVHHAHDLISNVKLKPLLGEICICSIVVVVILKQFSHQKESPWAGVLALIYTDEIAIAIFVTTPINDSTLNWSHQKMYR